MVYFFSLLLIECFVIKVDEKIMSVHADVVSSMHSRIATPFPYNDLIDVLHSNVHSN